MRVMWRDWDERMAFLQHKPSDIQTIDLNGPDGNAWCILGIGQSLAQNLRIDFIPISSEMMSGNYRHLVETEIPTNQKPNRATLPLPMCVNSHRKATPKSTKSIKMQF
jgi:hypothetical protein